MTATAAADLSFLPALPAAVPPTLGDHPFEMLEQYGYTGALGYRRCMTPADHEAVAYANRLIHEWPVVLDDERRPELYRFTAMLLEKGLLLDEILSAADYLNLSSFRPMLAPADVREGVQWALEDREKSAAKRDFDRAADTAAAEQPSIKFLPQELIAATDRTLAAMLADTANELVLSYDGYCTMRRGRLVRLDDAASLRERAMRSAKFWTYKYKAWQPDSCPEPIVQTLLARNGEGAPQFRGALTAPTIRADGGVISKPGLDESTGLYATFANGDFWVLPDRPTHEAAQEAYLWLARTVFDEFPFAESLDAAVAVAALLTGLVRRTCGLAPAFLFDSATRSSGKTTLAQFIGEMAGGSRPAPWDWAATEEEMVKVVFAALRDAQPAILFDNIKTGTAVDSPTFAKLITADTFKGRVLGQSRTGELPSAVLVLLTGTNLQLQGDSPTRILACRLEPRMERPDKRAFRRGDVFAWGRDRRAEIVQAALTIIKAYQMAGAPSVGTTATRFPQWDAMVRRPVLWASGVDIAGKTDSAYEADETVTAIRELHRAWHAALGDKTATAGEVHDIAAGAVDGPGAQFARAMTTLTGELRVGAMKAQLVGRKLKDIRDRVIDDRMITSRYDSNRKQHLWYLAAVQSNRNGDASIFD
jgi:putative DNA primase/helicase